jgi:hypothetical protein
MRVVLTVVLLPVLAMAQAGTLQVNQGTQTSSGAAPVTTAITSINGATQAAHTIQGAGTVTVSTNTATGVTLVTGTAGGGGGNATSILGQTVPPLVTGFLEWNGSAFVWGTPSGGGGAPTNPFTITNGGNSFTITVPPTSGNPVLSSTSGGINFASLFVTNLAGTGNSLLQVDSAGNVTRGNTVNLGTNRLQLNVAATATSGILMQEAGTATGQNPVLDVMTNPGSSAIPFIATAGGPSKGLGVTSTGDVSLEGGSNLYLHTLTNAASLATNAQGMVVAGGGSGITSINGNTNAAQLITAGTGISVDFTTTPGTTVINNTVTPTITHPVVPLAAGTYNPTVSDFANCRFLRMAGGAANNIILPNPAGTFGNTDPVPPNGQCIKVMNLGSLAQTVVINPNGLNLNNRAVTNAFSITGSGSNTTDFANVVTVYSDGSNYWAESSTGITNFGRLAPGTLSNGTFNISTGATLTTQTGTSGLINANQINGQTMPLNATALAANGNGQIIAASPNGMTTNVAFDTTTGTCTLTFNGGRLTNVQGAGCTSTPF